MAGLFDNRLTSVALEGVVVKVIDPYTVVANKGSADGILVGQTVALIGITEDDIIDPQTQESLGKLEIFKGRGRVKYVQEKLATIESMEKEVGKIVRRGGSGQGLMSSLGTWGIREEEVVEPPRILPFSDPSYGDVIRFMA